MTSALNIMKVAMNLTKQNMNNDHLSLFHANLPILFILEREMKVFEMHSYTAITYNQNTIL